MFYYVPKLFIVIKLLTTTNTLKSQWLTSKTKGRYGGECCSRAGAQNGTVLRSLSLMLLLLFNSQFPLGGAVHIDAFQLCTVNLYLPSGRASNYAHLLALFHDPWFPPGHPANHLGHVLRIMLPPSCHTAKCCKLLLAVIWLAPWRTKILPNDRLLIICRHKN